MNATCQICCIPETDSKVTFQMPAVRSELRTPARAREGIQQAYARCSTQLWWADANARLPLRYAATSSLRMTNGRRTPARTS